MMKRSVIPCWIPVTAYMGVIFAVSSLSHPETLAPTLLRSISDKVVHALEYGVLSLLCSSGFRCGLSGWAARHALVLSVIACNAYGLTDELHQAFVPNRDTSLWDLLADTVGASGAAAVVYLTGRSAPGFTKHSA